MPADPLGSALVALAAIGLADALYFVIARPPVVRGPYARVLGLPNPVYGLAWYGVVLVAGTARLLGGRIPLCAVLLAVAAGTVALSAFLAWALVVRLRTPCLFCFAGHLVNAALLVVLALACSWP
ncbi:MAG: vitamin K epoxide reductase family protein [bacterium]